MSCFEIREDVFVLLGAVWRGFVRRKFVLYKILCKILCKGFIGLEVRGVLVCFFRDLVLILI